MSDLRWNRGALRQLEGSPQIVALTRRAGTQVRDTARTLSGSRNATRGVQMEMDRDGQGPLARVGWVRTRRGFHLRFLEQSGKRPHLVPALRRRYHL